MCVCVCVDIEFGVVDRMSQFLLECLTAGNESEIPT